MNAVKNSMHGAGKMLLVGGAAAAGIAVLAGMFGGRKKDPEMEQIASESKQQTQLPTPEMMMATAPQPSRGIMPSGSMPGSEVNISELLSNKGGPQYAMGM